MISKNKKEPKDIHVVVGLSGGVDSAVSLYLLKKAGYKVTALFMRNWDSQANLELTNHDEVCQQEQDYEDAKKIAKQLNVPLKRVDFVKEYWDLVFEQSLEEYKKGITPNPDMLCNRYIKFDLMLNYAKNKLQADMVATGHYAKIIEKDNIFYLAKALDQTKDQTYFLSNIKKEVLKFLIFPLEDLKKIEVRKIAKDLKLEIADKKDSSGICFIGERNFEQFLSNYIKEEEGNIVDIYNNETIGKHKGISFYTIGQRKGLNLGGQEQSKYICKKDIEKNILYVANINDDDFLYKKSLIAIECNLLSKVPLDQDLEVEIKIRHSTISHKATLVLNKNNQANVTFKNKQRAITPGQWCVAYIDNICILSGIII